jgi:glycosyltransferase involved in cell wall biosynthesis
VDTLEENLDTPFFSVVIPSYNRADQLKEALSSVAGQTYRSFEVIICDDGSTDGTKDVAGSFFDRMPVQYHWEGNWGGPARPRNRGIGLARGEWVAFLDSDDWWHPEKLEVVRRHVDGADVIYHGLRTYDAKGKRRFRKAPTRRLQAPVFADLMRNGNALATSAVSIRKEILDQTGGFSEDPLLVAVEDFDLWLRIAGVTERFLCIPRSLGGYRAADEGITEVSERQVVRLETLYRKHMAVLSEPDRSQAGMWLNYMVGRLKYRMGRYREAREHFGVSCRSDNMTIRAKSLCCLALAMLKG